MTQCPINSQVDAVFPNFLHVSCKIIYRLGSNKASVRGVILIDMTYPMMFQTVSDVLDYVLIIGALLGSYAFNIFDQAHITPK